MITKISSSKNGQMVYYFSNGIILSFIWSWGSYSDNNMKRPADFTRPDLDEWESQTVECYSMGENESIESTLEQRYGGNPAGYIPVNDIPLLISIADGL